MSAMSPSREMTNLANVEAESVRRWTRQLWQPGAFSRSSISPRSGRGHSSSSYQNAQVQLLGYEFRELAENYANSLEDLANGLRVLNFVCTEAFTQFFQRTISHTQEIQDHIAHIFNNLAHQTQLAAGQTGSWTSWCPWQSSNASRELNLDHPDLQRGKKGLAYATELNKLILETIHTRSFIAQNHARNSHEASCRQSVEFRRRASLSCARAALDARDEYAYPLLPDQNRGSQTSIDLEVDTESGLSLEQVARAWFRLPHIETHRPSTPTTDPRRPVSRGTLFSSSDMDRDEVSTQYSRRSRGSMSVVNWSPPFRQPHASPRATGVLEILACRRPLSSGRSTRSRATASEAGTVRSRRSTDATSEVPDEVRSSTRSGGRRERLNLSPQSPTSPSTRGRWQDSDMEQDFLGLGVRFS